MSPSQLRQLLLANGPTIMIKRLNLKQFQTAHEAQLSGQAPEKKLILV